MSKFDTTLALSAYTWAIKAIEDEIENIQPRWWRHKLTQAEQDRITVLRALEKQFRKHRDGLGTGARKKAS